MEKKPNKKDELSVVNNVLKLATKLMKVGLPLQINNSKPRSNLTKAVESGISQLTVEQKSLCSDRSLVSMMLTLLWPCPRSWTPPSGCWA